MDLDNSHQWVINSLCEKLRKNCLDSAENLNWSILVSLKNDNDLYAPEIMQQKFIASSNRGIIHPD